MAIPHPRHAAHDVLDERTRQRADRLGRIITIYVFGGGISGPYDAAAAVLTDRDVADAFAAADLVAELDRRHQPVRWADNSPTVVCTAGCGAHPCDVADLIAAHRLGRVTP